MCLCFRSLVAADLKGEPGPVDDEADNDLWVDSAFFRAPDLSETVFLLCFEISGRDVIEEETDSRGGHGVVEALACDFRPVVTVSCAGQTVEESVVVGRINAEFGQDTEAIGLRRRFNQTSQHELKERLIINDFAEA